MYKIIKVVPLENYRLNLSFDDGTTGVIDLSNLAGHGVFALWNDYAEFRDVKIGATGEIIWSDQIDICPDSLYLKITGKTPEDIFPALNKELMHA